MRKPCLRGKAALARQRGQALAFALIIGTPERFHCGRQIASYLGLIPREHSSAGHQRLGAISKQGNRFVRMLLVEAAQSAVRYDPEFRREYQHRCHTKPKNVPRWRWRGNWRYDSTGCCAPIGRNALES